MQICAKIQGEMSYKVTQNGSFTSMQLNNVQIEDTRLKACQ